MPPEILATLTRGDLEECHHFGAYCVVEDGRVVASRGDVETPYYMRSSAKPFQALAVVESGAVEEYGLTEKELAICVGSHNGSPDHAKTAQSILDKCEESAELLRCGGHRPLSTKVWEAYVRAGYVYGRLEDNCSGKHAGMIAASKLWGDAPANYAEESGRVQSHVRDAVLKYAGLEAADLTTAMDGCAVPSFAMGVRPMATAIAAFVQRGERPAADRIADAMRAHPEMVAGDGRFDTRLMRAADGKLISKMGAEGVQVIGVPERGLGIAIKVLDGGARAVRAVATELLAKYDVVDARGLADRVVRTRDGDPVGEVRVTL